MKKIKETILGYTCATRTGGRPTPVQRDRKRCEGDRRLSRRIYKSEEWDIYTLASVRTLDSRGYTHSVKFILKDGNGHELPERSDIGIHLVAELERIHRWKPPADGEINPYV